MLHCTHNVLSLTYCRRRRRRRRSRFDCNPLPAVATAPAPSLLLCRRSILSAECACCAAPNEHIVQVA